MAKQDTYARISIRVPPELYEKLQAAAGDKSLNAEIISRLEDSFSKRLAILDAELDELRRNWRASYKFEEDVMADIGGRLLDNRRLREEIRNLKEEKELLLPDLNVNLDTNGQPICWDEIRAHAREISKIIGDRNWSLHMQITTPKVESNVDRAREAAAIEAFYKREERQKAQYFARKSKPKEKADGTTPEASSPPKTDPADGSDQQSSS